jgi:hypothetical protein
MKISPPAFPTYLAENMALGMTLRDYFAAAALPTIIQSWNTDHRELYTGSDLEGEQICATAYEFADAMLAERDK